MGKARPLKRICFTGRAFLQLNPQDFGKPPVFVVEDDIALPERITLGQIAFLNRQILFHVSCQNCLAVFWDIPYGGAAKDLFKTDLQINSPIQVGRQEVREKAGHLL